MEVRRLTVELRVPGGRVRVEADVPMGDVPMESLLPALRATADAFVAHASGRTAAAGAPVSCAKGCGACCRQLVPVGPAEARRLAAFVEELPEPRRAEVKRRFDDARARLEAAGVLPALRGGVRWDAAKAKELGLAYFRAGVACPFLEDESCSIYEERPIACREYLVTSPAARCAAPTRETIRMVELPAIVWAAAAREERGVPDTEPAPSLPLVLAPGWAAANPGPGPVRSGPETIRAVYARFATDRTADGGRP